MNSITIREALAEDASQLIEYMKTVGAETENLSFGGEGLPVSIEQEAAFLGGGSPRRRRPSIWQRLRTGKS